MSVGSLTHQLFLQIMIAEGVLSLEESKQLYKKLARACGGKTSAIIQKSGFNESCIVIGYR